MKAKHLLPVMLLAVASTASARDIHGVNGYHNWTAAQMLADGFVRVDPNTGNKDANWLPSINFDGGYLNDILGVGGADDNAKEGERSWWRSTVYFNYRAQEANLTITKDYPVLMFKFSLPKNGVIEGNPVQSPVLTVEHWWKNPYDGTNCLMNNKTGLGINGLAGNGRMDYMRSFPGIKCQQEGSLLLGRDSVKIGWEGNHTKYRTTDDGVVYVYRDVKVPATAVEGVSQVAVPTWTMGVLPTESTDRCEYICIMNYGSIEDTVSVENGGAESRRLLDRTNIESVGFHIMFFGYKTIADCTEAPTASVKWVKSFASYEEAMGTLTAANNWGDGVESAAKSQLNYALYYAEQDLNGFAFRNADVDNPDDPAYVAYLAAYNEANAVYENAASTDAEFEAAALKLQEARAALLAEADLPKDRVYNYIKSATGNGAIILGAEDVTVGSLTGKPLTIGTNEAATALSFVATGIKLNGQVAYRLVGENGEVVQATDGTLMLVQGQTGSSFTFAERDTEGNGFDIKCGDYYYYIDGNGVLSAAKEINVNKDDYDALSAYLFTITDALPDYADKASEEQKTGLKDGWEFNAAPVDDPGTKGTVDGVVKEMREYNETKMIEGWRMSRWRPFSRVNQETTKNADGTDAVCLALTAAEVYDNWDGSEAGVQNDFTNPAAARMDSGVEEPFYVRDPNPRDDTYGFDVNPGIKRYFAVKMKATDDVTFGTMNFFNGLTNSNVLVSIDQMTGKKGDVIYWDMLANGFSVGKQHFTGMFLSPTGFTSAESKLLVDWIRFYDTVENIPAEELKAIETGISDITAGKAGYDAVYDLSGRKVTAPKAGLYIIKTTEGAKKVILK